MSRRREILDLLWGGERAVQELVTALDIAQPTVSGHLRVLREVGLVNVRREGRRHVYTINADALRPIQRWVERFEGLWTDQIDRIQRRVEGKAAS